MTYQVIYRADTWAPAANGAPEWRQVVSVDLEDGTHLAVVVRRVGSDRPRMAEARIEQPYITRTASWKRRILKRLRPQEVELVADVGA